uniref:Uncharacterized protein n=1 Tax=Romanomermis culicivorax TaxID=13658 RepID=A0A915HQX3_ROMCU
MYDNQDILQDTEIADTDWVTPVSIKGSETKEFDRGIQISDPLELKKPDLQHISICTGNLKATEYETHIYAMHGANELGPELIKVLVVLRKMCKLGELTIADDKEFQTLI